MTVQGEVRFKVRRAVLMLKRFTMRQLLTVVGHSESSIRTEINRMVNDGLLVVTQESQRPRSAAGGRPPATYGIAPGKQVEIYNSIEPFFAGAQDMTAPPRSQYYQWACESLRSFFRDDEEVMTNRVRLLEEITEELDTAEFEEGLAGEGNEIGKAYLDRARAQVYLLKGEYDAARQLLGEVQMAFAGKGMIEQIDSVLNLQVAVGLRRLVSESPEKRDPSRLVAEMARLIQESEVSNALIWALKGFVEAALQPVRGEGDLTMIAESIFALAEQTRISNDLSRTSVRQVEGLVTALRSSVRTEARTPESAGEWPEVESYEAFAEKMSGRMFVMPPESRHQVH